MGHAIDTVVSECQPITRPPHEFDTSSSHLLLTCRVCLHVPEIELRLFKVKNVLIQLQSYIGPRSGHPDFTFIATNTLMMKSRFSSAGLSITQVSVSIAIQSTQSY